MRLALWTDSDDRVEFVELEACEVASLLSPSLLLLSLLLLLSPWLFRLPYVEWRRMPPPPLDVGCTCECPFLLALVPVVPVVPMGRMTVSIPSLFFFFFVVVMLLASFFLDDLFSVNNSLLVLLMLPPSSSVEEEDDGEEVAVEEADGPVRDDRPMEN